MEKDDQLDALISKLFKNIKHEVIPPKTACPGEEVLQKHIRGAIGEKETKRVERHLLSCPECIDTHEALRLIKTAEGSLLDVPGALLSNTKKALHRALQQSRSPAPRTILLLWDRMNNRIMQLPSKLARIVPSPIPRLQAILENLECKYLSDVPLQTKIEIDLSPIPELQAVREPPEYKKGLRDFPLRINIKGNTGEISLEVDRSRKKGFLTLKAHFRFTPPKPSTCVRAVLYKESRRIAAENFDDRSEVFFHAIKEGTYYLALFEEETCIEKIELPIVSVKNGD